MQLMTAEDIGTMLKLNPNHVRDRLTKTAGFPDAFRVSGALRWRESDILDWLESQSVSPKTRQSRKPVRHSKKVENSSRRDPPSVQAGAGPDASTTA